MVIKKAKKEESKKVTKKAKKVTRRSLLEEKLEFLLSIKKPSKEQKVEIEELTRQIKNSKTGSKSRRKGSTYERTIAEKFRVKYKVDLVRTPQSGGFAKKSKKADDFRGDIVSADKDIDLKLHIEAKNCKTVSMTKWLEQSEGDCPKNKVPLVIFHKPNSSKDYVTLSLEDFFSLVEKSKIISKKAGK